MNFYNLVSNCTTCRTNEKTAYNKKTEAAVFVFIGSAQFGSGQIGVPICVPVQTIVEYTSKYNHPANDIFQFPTSYNYPNFASFFTLVTANVTGQIPDSPPIMCIGGQTARYYNGSTLILTQSMDFVVVDATHHNACVSDVWTLGTNPTTVEFNGLFYMLEGVSGSKTTSSSAALTRSSFSQRSSRALRCERSAQSSSNSHLKKFFKNTRYSSVFDCFLDY